MSKVGIFGAGWVGLVTGVCFAELGHDVVVRDVVAQLREADTRDEADPAGAEDPDLAHVRAESTSGLLAV